MLQPGKVLHLPPVPLAAPLTVGVPDWSSAVRPHLERVVDTEIALLLEGVFRQYGYDFRDYAHASLRRRILHRVGVEKLSSVSALQERVLRDEAYFERLLLDLSVNVTGMFRDPGFFLAIRQKVVPRLRTYPFIRIWHAGCSTGEEVFSMAILLAEEGLLSRCRIYATDINESLLKTARKGIVPLRQMQEYTHNYQRAGGAATFSDYYTARYDAAIFRPALKNNIVFAQHNLVTDGAFNDFHLIVCRNVTIYFNRTLQDRVHRLFYQSLAPFGVLGFGTRESIKFTPHEQAYEELHAGEKLYRKTH